jgi:hypothetical protein
LTYLKILPVLRNAAAEEDIKVKTNPGGTARINMGTGLPLLYT